MNLQFLENNGTTQLALVLGFSRTLISKAIVTMMLLGPLLTQRTQTDADWTLGEHCVVTGST